MGKNKKKTIIDTGVGILYVDFVIFLKAINKPYLDICQKFSSIARKNNINIILFAAGEMSDCDKSHFDKVVTIPNMKKIGIKTKNFNIKSDNELGKAVLYSFSFQFNISYYNSSYKAYQKCSLTQCKNELFKQLQCNDNSKVKSILLQIKGDQNLGLSEMAEMANIIKEDTKNILNKI